MRTLLDMRIVDCVEWTRMLAGLTGAIVANVMLAAVGSILFA